MPPFIRMAFALLLLSAPMVAAADAGSALGLRAGTAGLALEYGYGWSPRVDLRAGYTFGSYTHGFDRDDIDYDGTFRFGAALAMLDFKPWAGGFRVSLGAYGASPRVRFKAEGENERYRVGAREYTFTGRLDGRVDLASAAPYLGVGWGTGTGTNGWGVSFDLGVMYTGSPSVALRATGRACESTLGACDPDSALFGFDVNDPDDSRAQTFQAELERERQNVERDSDDLEFWPVVNLGLHYRF